MKTRTKETIIKIFVLAFFTALCILVHNLAFAYANATRIIPALGGEIFAVPMVLFLLIQVWDLIEYLFNKRYKLEEELSSECATGMAKFKKNSVVVYKKQNGKIIKEKRKLSDFKNDIELYEYLAQ